MNPFHDELGRLQGHLRDLDRDLIGLHIAARYASGTAPPGWPVLSNGKPHELYLDGYPAGRMRSKPAKGFVKVPGLWRSPSADDVAKTMEDIPSRIGETVALAEKILERLPLELRPSQPSPVTCIMTAPSYCEAALRFAGRVIHAFQPRSQVSKGRLIPVGIPVQTLEWFVNVLTEGLAVQLRSGIEAELRTCIQRAELLSLNRNLQRIGADSGEDDRRTRSMTPTPGKPGRPKDSSVDQRALFVAEFQSRNTDWTFGKILESYRAAFPNDVGVDVKALKYAADPRRKKS